MDDLSLEPGYGTNELQSRCVKCLAEKELSDCLSELLGNTENDEHLQSRYMLLVEFLQSTEAKTLLNESEKYLSEGKKVTVKLSFHGEKPEYRLEINESNEGVIK
ncbi:hypothetical protein ACFLUG_00055 [Chloroflexota bacterium]